MSYSIVDQNLKQEPDQLKYLFPKELESHPYILKLKELGVYEKWLENLVNQNDSNDIVEKFNKLILDKSREDKSKKLLKEVSDQFDLEKNNPKGNILKASEYLIILDLFSVISCFK